MSHATHRNESCHTQECVMSHIGTSFQKSAPYAFENAYGANESTE